MVRPKFGFYFLFDKLSRMNTSCPLDAKCKDVGQPKYPSAPKIKIFIFLKIYYTKYTYFPILIKLEFMSMDGIL